MQWLQVHTAGLHERARKMFVKEPGRRQVARAKMECLLCSLTHIRMYIYLKIVHHFSFDPLQSVPFRGISELEERVTRVSRRSVIIAAQHV